MNKTFLALIFAVAMAVSFRASAQGTVDSRVSYQGFLKDYGISPDDSGHYDFRYGVVIGPLDPDNPWRTNCPNCYTALLRTNSITVNQGLFTTTLTMPTGPLRAGFMDGTNVFLEFAIRTNGGGAFTTLEPMQPLSATPFAIIAQSVSGPIQASSLTGTMPTGMLTGIFSSPLNLSNPSNVFAGDGSLLTHLNASNLIGTMPTGMLTGIFSSPLNLSNPSNFFAGDGSLLTHVNATTIGGLNPCSLPCYWNILGNSLTDPNVNFLGTTDNKTVVFRANNEVVMRYQPHPGNPSIIGGNSANTILSGAGGAVIAGGGTPSLPNQIWNDGSAIGGGYANYIRGRECFIGGGWANFIDDLSLSNTHCATITGGTNNYVNADFAFIGGGINNSARGISSVVAGGANNNTLALYSAISGGSDNAIIGETSSIGGGTGNQIGAATGAGRASFIGGGSGNRIFALANNVPAEWDVIAGGNSNLISAVWSVIGGGGYNAVLANDATLSGGIFNTIALNGHLGTVGGGANNYVNADSATISGGFNNYISGNGAFIGGGWFNNANGIGATIPGGITNAASGYASFAAGNRAKALNDGTYVWSDSQNADFASTANDQYLIRAAGGVGIGTATPVMQLHVQGDTRVTGVLRSGSETGTSQLPSPAGLVVRRINSTSAALNQVVARNDHVTLERDGSNGGMVIRYPAGSFRQVVACTAMTSAGTQINYYNTLLNPGIASTLSIFSGVTNVVQFRCTFGDSYNSGHHTEVNMIREGTDFYWVGTLTSTYNQ